MGACVETGYRKEGGSRFNKDKEYIEFTITDVVPIKYNHFITEYEFEKNLPSIKDTISNFMSE